MGTNSVEQRSKSLTHTRATALAPIPIPVVIWIQRPSDFLRYTGQPRGLPCQWWRVHVDWSSNEECYATQSWNVSIQGRRACEVGGAKSRCLLPSFAPVMKTCQLTGPTGARCLGKLAFAVALSALSSCEEEFIRLNNLRLVIIRAQPK